MRQPVVLAILLLTSIFMSFSQPYDSDESNYSAELVFPSSNLVPSKSPSSSAMAEPSKPSVIWDEAHSNGWSDSSRDSNEIYRIIIHVTQGSYSGTISWFNNPDAGVAAHYVINNHDAPYSSNQNSQDGKITQMVKDEDIGYHDANANAHSIGIEHSAYIDPNNGYHVQGNFSTAMYQESAKLVAWLTFRYNIPVDRHFIVGHSEDEHIGGTSSHQDPGPDWNWSYYFDLIEFHRGRIHYFPLDRVVEITQDTLIHSTPLHSPSQGLQANVGEQYHAVEFCYCQPTNFVRIWFNSSESAWVNTNHVRQVTSTTLVETNLADEYGWLNVRDSAGGNDLGNLFNGQSFVMVQSGTWSEYWYQGRPTAFSHSDYLTERSWVAPAPQTAPNVTTPPENMTLGEVAVWGLHPTLEEMMYQQYYSLSMFRPSGSEALNETFYTNSNNKSHYLDEAGEWSWEMTFFDVLGIAGVPLSGTIEVAEPIPEDVLGCTNESALNFNINATVDDGSCEFPSPPPIVGCMDENATNFDLNATEDDGTCEYPLPSPVLGCMDENATNFDLNATEDDGTCEYPQLEPVPVLGCTYANATNFVTNATVDDGSCTFSSAEDSKSGPVYGCTYAFATNYDANATFDDGSCEFYESNLGPVDGSTEQVDEEFTGDASLGQDESESESNDFKEIFSTMPLIFLISMLVLGLLVTIMALTFRD